MICTDKKQDGHCWPSRLCCFSVSIGWLGLLKGSLHSLALDAGSRNGLKRLFLIAGLWHIFVLTLKSQCHAIPRQAQHFNLSINSCHKKSIYSKVSSGFRMNQQRRTCKMSKKNGHPIYSPRREAEKPPPEKIRCNIKPECEGCPFPSHGFICWSTDGSCLRSNMKKIQKGGRGHEKHLS